MTDPRDSRRVLGRQLERRPDLGRPLNEQTHGVGPGQHVGLRRICALGYRQGGHPPGGLARNAEWLAAGRHDREAGAPSQQRIDQHRD
jgi:hypothetical protein